MKIGLIRHHTVDYKFCGWVTSKGFLKEVENYYSAPVISNGVKFSLKEWDIAYSSDIERAVVTALDTYDGIIIKTGLLREVPARPLAKFMPYLPFEMVKDWARFAWKVNSKTQPETKRKTEARAREFIENYLKKSDYENILIFTHGFFMNTLQSELLKAGFEGEYIKSPENGEIYLFTKENADED